MPMPIGLAQRLLQQPLRPLLLITAVFALQACVVNPVTGKRELSLVSESQELNIGAQSYAPLSQAEGGRYAVDSKLEAYVKEVGQRVAAVSDRPLPYEFTLLNNPVPNAWALPGGKIAVNLGLLWELDNEAELAAVLGHEVVHAAARHGARAQTRGILLQGALFGASVAMGGGDAVLGAANIGAQYAMASRGRDAELESDLYGTRYLQKAGYDPQAAVTLQEAFVRMSQGRQQDFFSQLFSSHPPSQERVDKNRETAASLPAGGSLNRDRFQQKTAYIRKVKPAYDAYLEARKSLSENNKAEAEKHIDRALRIEQREPRFQSFKGDMLSARDDWKGALKYYETALKLDGSWFMFWLDRGIARYHLKQISGAKSDLEQSIKRLPTSPGHLYLGHIAVKHNDRNNAIKHYQTAAQGGGEVGKEAQTALLRLDLANNPSKYLGVSAALTPQGQLVLTVNNPTAVAVKNVVVTVSDNSRSWQQSFSDVLAGGKQAQRNTGLGPWSREQAQQLKIQITAAEVAE